jgi:hypothetical protein
MVLDVFIKIMLAQGALAAIEWALANLVNLSLPTVWFLPREWILMMLGAALTALATWVRNQTPTLRQTQPTFIVWRIFGIAR